MGPEIASVEIQIGGKKEGLKSIVNFELLKAEDKRQSSLLCSIAMMMHSLNWQTLWQ